MHFMVYLCKLLCSLHGLSLEIEQYAFHGISLEMGVFTTWFIFRNGNFHYMVYL